MLRVWICDLDLRLCLDLRYYVERGCLTLYDVPRTEAPQLFQYSDGGRDDYKHCYVCKQPSTPKETDDMLRVISKAELQCIHYRGSDPGILKRLVALGESVVCDVLAGKKP